MTRMTVLGGSGFLGSRTATALEKVPGVEVMRASRRAGLRVDVTRPETYGALEGTELLVDLADATSHAPDGLIGWCLEHDVTVLEATSDAACVERLHRRFRGTRGRLVLGGGIFTGMSNLLARDVTARVPTLRSVTLGISSSPFSGAGRSTIELMLGFLGVPAPRYAAHQRLEVPSPGPGPLLELSRSKRPSLRVPFAETFMLHESTGAADVDVYFAPRPAMLVRAFAMLPEFLVASSLGRAALRGYFTLIRRGLFRSVASRVELVATSVGLSSTATRCLDAEDGMMAGAWALAAQAEAVQASTGTGVQLIDDVAALEPIVARANQLAGHRALELSEPRVAVDEKPGER